jgi:hypothetical protein
MQVIEHQIHGQSLHDLNIYLAERICIQRGYIHADKRWFADKHYARGVPDIFVKRSSHCNGTNGKRRDVTEYLVIEIESKLTVANRLKKYKQFQETVTGVELQIINLADNKYQDSIEKTIAFLDARIP